MQAMLATKQHTPLLIYTHAEIDCLSKAKRQKIDTLVILRKNKAGIFVNAKPCRICQEAISLSGVTNVLHS